MNPTRRDFGALTLGLSAAVALPASPSVAAGRAPLVIATGGATGDAPAGTIGAYEQAIRDGADYLAADLVPSKDGVLIARSDHELSESTDIASRPEFAGRKATRQVNGRERTGWFVEDLTLLELKTLVCQTPGTRRRGGETGRAILTLDDIIATARSGSVRSARVVGVWAGLSNSAYYAGLDLAVEPFLATAISVAGYNAPAAAMFVASGEPDSLRTLGGLTRARRVLRLSAGEAGSLPEPGTIRAYAGAVAASPASLLDFSSPKTLPATAFLTASLANGLSVQAWMGGDAIPPPFHPGDARRISGALFSAGCEAVAGELAAPISRGRDDAISRERG